MLQTSCSWDDNDELSFVKDESNYPEKTVYRTGITSVLSASKSSHQLNIKCEIDIKFAPSQLFVVEIRAISNARNIELYIAKEKETFQYVKTTRGVFLHKEHTNEFYQTTISDCFGDAIAIRLRMLSLRGDKTSCHLHELELHCKPAHLSFEVVETPTIDSLQSDSDLRVEHLATIGTQLLHAAETRLLARLDSISLDINDRLDRALAKQSARLDNIEQLLRERLLPQQPLLQGLETNHKTVAQESPTFRHNHEEESPSSSS